eukprot:TRINITY_DN6182_c0_g1_i3.p1 TRINITY_DN6182_c0_g1~~TRINITY_DN6182_c0_g1_i3.p1  ORF type:complete len:644 (+),score=116.89 TRINITY_DN6182_c0_g1_i3:1956-3887(+)
MAAEAPSRKTSMYLLPYGISASELAIGMSNKSFRLEAAQSPSSSNILKELNVITETGELSTAHLESSADTIETGLEAVIKRVVRPSLVVQNGELRLPRQPLWINVLTSCQHLFQKHLAAVGRVERGDSVTFRTRTEGTAWLIAPSIAITNTHVARELVVKDSATMELSLPSAFVNFAECPKARESGLRARVLKVLYMAPNWREEYVAYPPDVALLQLDMSTIPEPDRPQPIPLEDDPEFALGIDSQIGVIGYPAPDTGGEQTTMEQSAYFKDELNIKRFAPGLLTGYYGDNNEAMKHDASTLGGNSGSVVLNLYSGGAVGLHYSGWKLQYNLAITIPVILGVLKDSGVVHVSAKPPVEPVRAVFDSAADVDPGSFDQRAGYDSAFLTGFDVAMPIVRQLGQEADNDFPLKYFSYTIVRNRKRNLCWFAAANVTCGPTVTGTSTPFGWFQDPRLHADFQQTIDDFYATSGYEKARMAVLETPQEAAKDTYCFTNRAPQWPKVFNQESWRNLELFVRQRIQVSNTMDPIKMCVFTGPICKDEDMFVVPELKVPETFWKVIVVDNGGRLSCAAFVIGQQPDLVANRISALENLENIGELPDVFTTYQVSLVSLSKATELDFGKLTEFSPELSAQVPIQSAKDLVLV